jgi:hypothetical protein
MRIARFAWNRGPVAAGWYEWLVIRLPFRATIPRRRLETEPLPTSVGSSASAFAMS